MLTDWRKGFHSGGGMFSTGGITPAKCKGCGNVVSANGVTQSVQVCPKCRIGGSRSKPKRKRK